MAPVLRLFRRNRRLGPRPDVVDGTYERDPGANLSLFVPDGPPEAWWVDPETMGGRPELQPDRQGRVRARLRVAGWPSEPGRYGPLELYDRTFDLLSIHFGEALPTRRAVIDHVAFTMEADDLDRAAAAVGQALGTVLHPQDSPMIGRWYADVEPGALSASASAVRGEVAGPSAGRGPLVRVMVTRNDPEPGVVPPRDPDGLPYVVSVLSLPGLESRALWTLTAAGAEVRPVGPYLAP